MRRHAGVLLIILVALNLRPAVVAVGPLLGQIRADFGLSGAAAGALTTLPVLFFGAFGLVAPFLRRGPRSEMLLVTSMGLVVVALLVRVLPGQAALFAGSMLAGIAISVGNIAVPTIIKRDHPRAVTTITAYYTVAVTAGAAVSTSVVVPIEHVAASTWRLPLTLLAIPAALAGLAWLARAARTTVVGPPRLGEAPRIWRSSVAWWVTAFMGIQSLVAFVVFGWLPTICQDRGLSEAAGGYMVGLNSLIQAAGALAFPLVERRLRDHRRLVVLTAALCVAGLAGVAWAPAGTMWVWVVVLGFGQGVAFALALSFIGLRARDAHVAGQLSGMSQGVGYMIAALGPLGMGAVHDATHGWSVPMAILIAVSAVLTLPGLGACRDRMIGAETEAVLAGRS